MGAFYKVVLNGEYAGKDNKNILWYRAAIDVADGAFGIGGAVQLAQLVKDQVVPEFLAVKPNSYTLQDIDVYPHNELLQIIYQLPYKLRVNLPGTATGWTSGMDGPALAVNMRFNLEPVTIGLQGLTAPKRGYVAIGPLNSDWIDNNGKLSDNLFTDPSGPFKALADGLSENLESLLPPAVFFPIRVSQKWGVGESAGNLVSWGYADVSSVTWDNYVTFRRSRRIKG